MMVAEIMNKNVKTTTHEASVQNAAKTMTKYRIGSLIVTKNGRLVGIVTERDILSKVVAKGKDPRKTKIKSIMVTDVVLAKPNMDIEEAAKIMIKYKIKKLPIVEGNQLIGIITASDIVSAQPVLMKRLSELFLISGKKLFAG